MSVLEGWNIGRLICGNCSQRWGLFISRVPPIINIMVIKTEAYVGNVEITAISEIHEVSVSVYFIHEGQVSQPSSYD